MKVLTPLELVAEVTTVVVTLWVAIAALVDVLVVAETIAESYYHYW